MIIIIIIMIVKIIIIDSHESSPSTLSSTQNPVSGSANADETDNK